MTAVTLACLDASRVAQRQSVDNGLPWQVFRDAKDLVCKQEPDLPVLCFSPKQLESSVRLFLDGFSGCVAYAVKANSSHDVLDCVARSGIKVFDVASTGEMADVSQATTDCTFHYHNPVKSRREIATAYETYSCRRFAADTIAEIDKIAAVVGATDDVEIAIRFRLPAKGHSMHDFSSKFGANPSQAVTLLQHVAAKGFSCVLTFHPGSQCVDPAAWIRHIGVAGDIARMAGCKLKTLNIGGGFPVQYCGRESLDMNSLFGVIEKAVKDSFDGSGLPALECEPGRAIVAQSQSVLTRVKLVRPERKEIFLNDGIYGALLEVTQVPELMPPHRAILQAGDDCGSVADWTVFGPTCDPLDMLPVKIALPCDIAEDDYIEFGSIGAYGMATITSFNGYGKFQRAWLDTVLNA